MSSRSPIHSRLFRISRAHARTAVASPIAVVVTCKGRLNHLKVSLPSILGQLGCSDRVVVVDYGDPDGAFEYCVSLASPKLVALKVLDLTSSFNLSRARNCGANTADCETLCFVDADSILHPDFLTRATLPIVTKRAGLTRRQFDRDNSDFCGVCCVRRDLYHGVRGYDESLEGWGPEDLDFYDRIARLAPVYAFPAYLYPGVIRHSDADRTRYYHSKDRLLNAERMRSSLRRRTTPINSAGYGRCLALVFADGRVQQRQLREPEIAESWTVGPVSSASILNP